ncbi:Piso0_005461 [Millerozyma farinosa CBS 7064]|uniref:CENP-C homolog n=1 Tax=Pichia sorbitophila (strain ATCC MYA-4447 / BCRC 22081 / CBS 7064 / NBRC 10061 / NRRL Y-12695) TaxID=559304 RepID=G8Y558_PICSO|nr:Piso0_005461 [Millerozyma farinosa CBS 7064]
MDLLKLGLQSRKTGLKPRDNLRKDKYDMEDIDEFFADEEEEVKEERGNRTTKSIARDNIEPIDSGRYAVAKDTRSNSGVSSYSKGSHLSAAVTTPEQPSNFNNLARKINFTDAEAESFDLSPIAILSKNNRKNEKAPLRSPLQENKGASLDEGVASGDDDLYRFEDNDVDDNFLGEERDMSLSPIELSPIKVRNQAHSIESTPKRNASRETTSKQSSGKPLSTKSVSSITKNMALGVMGKKRRKKPMIIEDDSDSYDDDYVSSPPQDSSDLISPPPTNKKKKGNSVSRQISSRNTPKETIIKPSPLPSPPPDGLRRSKRTRISPLAFWRNERVVYTRANEHMQGPDTTLARDIERIPLQEIKEVVHIPEVPEQNPQPKKRPRGRPPKNSSPKSKRPSPKPPAVYEYESDPEISGSEWFSDKTLTLRVFEGPNDKRVERDIAWAPNEGNFIDSPNTEGLENFKVATLFGNDRDFTAGGLIEFPYGGFKNLRNSSDSVYIFHVVKGLIEVTLNEDKFVVTKGCSFQVPRANSFAFKNLSQDNSKLFFVQSKKVLIEGDESE